MSISSVDLKSPKIIGGVLLLVLAFALLTVSFTQWLSANAERRLLEERLSSNRHTAAQMAQLREAAPEQLQQELDEARRQLAERLEVFPSFEEAMAEIAAYYTLAARYETEIARLEAQMTPRSPDPDVIIREEAYLVEARGPVRNLLRLLGAITDAPFETLIYRDVSLGQDGPAWAELQVTVLWRDLDLSTWTQPTQGPAAP